MAQGRSRTPILAAGMDGCVAKPIELARPFALETALSPAPDTPAPAAVPA